MADYLNVPKVADVFTDGNILFDKYQVGNYRVGYVGSNNDVVRVGCYKDSNNQSVWVFGSPNQISSIDIQCVSPAGVKIFGASSLASQYEGGYYAIARYNVFPLAGVVHVNVFLSLQEVLDAFNYETPSATGVTVVIKAVQSVTPIPSTTGLVVVATARLGDPNTQGGTSETGGGQGTFDDTSWPVPIPSIPTISATSSGLVSLFKPTIAQLNELSGYLWTHLSDFIENLNKLFANPMDYLIALNIFPCDPEVGTARAINIGSVTTEITMSPVLSQWYELNCGEITLAEYWGSALDYAPNTRVSLFLPFIGVVTLNTDEVMGNSIGVTYRIDLLSGQCVAMVTVNSDVYYQFTGQCSVSIPMTGADWSRIYSAAIGAVGTAIAGGIGAAAGAGAANSLVTSTNAASSSINAGAHAVTAYSGIVGKGAAAKQLRQQMVDAANLAMQNAQNVASAPSRPSGGIAATRIANTVNNTVGQVMGGKINVQHSGSISGSAGMLGVRTPFLIIEYPNQSMPDNYRHFVGYPANITETLGSLTGYTELEKVIIGIWGTDNELAELVEALKGGVYL